jgi:hypothetical protein
MLKALRSSLTYSNVVSTLCLFMLLGGVAYAASQLAPNSVGTKELKNGAVTLKKINKKAQSKLRGAVGPKGDSGKEGKEGKKGAKGSTGNPGAPGTPGVGVAALFGSGADGNATLSGTANTLSRDTYYNNLTLNPGAVLNTNGYRLFVAGTLTMGNGSNINRDGLTAIMGCGPWTSPLPAHTLGGAGAGGCNGGGGEGGDVANSLGGEGGGTGSSTGAADPPETDVGGVQVFDSATQALTGRSLDGELVYGGGGGEGTNPTIGGGQGGGVVVIAARTVVSTGSTSITANGGEGLYGGGGGVVVVISTSAQPAGLTIGAAGGDGQGSGSELAEPGFAEWLD